MGILLRPACGSVLRVRIGHLSRLALEALICLVLPIALHGKQPSPPPIPEQLKAGAEQTKGSDEQATIKTRVRQVLLDVVVTDG